MIDNPIQTLIHLLGGGGQASIETIPVIDNHHVQPEVSLYSIRGLPTWQMYKQ